MVNKNHYATTGVLGRRQDAALEEAFRKADTNGDGRLTVDDYLKVPDPSSLPFSIVSAESSFLICPKTCVN